MAKPPSLTAQKIALKGTNHAYKAFLEAERKASEEYRARLATVVKSPEDDAIISKILVVLSTSWTLPLHYPLFQKSIIHE